ncbi:MAG: 1-(5-phosphoribosyl)-5-[(5-phosphoribosylamino)methylideneamino]imidazole-4-carboxamide isomerase [Deltaproteobacteria bacterium]|nr:1-(5-phosphoribosyl)-5-[(5-phosphoribosylamino)methylideneamino]imidazole-4-carboxamide isomerase [Deltaproteobacteria bacterium]
MIVIPAIDLKDGKCVRLAQGEMDQSTVYSEDPVEVALRWEQKGATRLHIVDLDGAVSGKPRNKDLVKQICSAVSMAVELGGGIRDITTVAEYLSAGVEYCILGTAAIKDPDFLQQCCEEHGGSIIVGIDARDGMVAVQGWTETTSISAIDFAGKLDPVAVAAVVFTDIGRDGMLTGPNTESTAQLAEAVEIPVIASGGVACIDDIKELLKVEKSGIMGVITGRALYTGDLDLEECVALMKNQL